MKYCAGEVDRVFRLFYTLCHYWKNNILEQCFQIVFQRALTFSKDVSGRGGRVRRPSRPLTSASPASTRKVLFYLFYMLGLHACFHSDIKSSAGFFGNKKLENPCAWNSTEPTETPRGGGRKKINHLHLQGNDSQ